MSENFEKQDELVDKIRNTINEFLNKEFEDIPMQTYFQTVGNVYTWLLMDFIDNVFKKDYFDKKIVFCDSFSSMCKQLISFREKQRLQQFDS